MSRKENRPMNNQQQSSVHKQLIRNAVSNEPVKKVKVIKHVEGGDVIVGDFDITAHQTRLHAPKKNDNDFSAPKLHSTLAIAKKLDALQLAKIQPAKSLNDLTPRSKSIANEKVLKKLNYPVDCNIYKHLIPINVNDSALEVKPRCRQVRRKPVATDPVPMLVDYLRPTKPLEHRLQLEDDDDLDAATLRKPDCNYFRHTYEFYERHLCPMAMTHMSDAFKGKAH